MSVFPLGSTIVVPKYYGYSTTVRETCLRLAECTAFLLLLLLLLLLLTGSLESLALTLTSVALPHCTLCMQTLADVLLRFAPSTILLSLTASLLSFHTPGTWLPGGRGVRRLLSSRPLCLFLSLFFVRLSLPENLHINDSLMCHVRSSIWVRLATCKGKWNKRSLLQLCGCMHAHTVAVNGGRGEVSYQVS